MTQSLALAPALLASLVLASSAAAQCEEEYFQPPDPSPSKNFGHSIDIDGDLALVGTWGDDDHGENSGSAYVLERGATGWELTDELYAATPAEEERAGGEVALSGDTAAVLAFGIEEISIYTRGPGGWALDDVLPSPTIPSPFLVYGRAMVMDGDWLAVADWAYATTGAVFLFHRDAAGDWSLAQTLLADTPEPSDRFGYSLAIEGTRLVVGTPYDRVTPTERLGSASVFDLVGGTWTLSAVIPGDALHSAWGWTVGISGGTLAMGPSGGPSGNVQLGAVRLFEESGGAWTETAYLTNGVENTPTFYGRGFALEGDRLIVTASEERLFVGPGAELSHGRAYLYQRNGGSWDLTGVRYGMPEGGLLSAVDLSGDQVVIRERRSDFSSSYAIQVFDFAPHMAEPFCFCEVAGCSNLDPLAGCANATGSGARLLACGSTSVTGDDLRLVATGSEPNQFGVLFMGSTTMAASFFGNGRRCVDDPVALRRFHVEQADAAGTFRYGPNLVQESQSFPAGAAISAGATWHFQLWYRDTGACLQGSNVTNGVSVTFAP